MKVFILFFKIFKKPLSSHLIN